MISLRLAALLLVATATVAPAQGTIVDEGTFVVTRNGADAGRESFRITRESTAAGVSYSATGTRSIGDTRIRSALRADSLGAPLSYQVEVLERGTQTLQLRGQAAGTRLTVRASSKTGEVWTKDYLLQPGAVLLDDDLLHQLALLPLDGRRASAVALVPRSSGQSTSRFASAGSDPVTIGGHAVAATKYRLGEGAAARELWIDSKGRLIRATVPAQGIIAVRDELPH